MVDAASKHRLSLLSRVLALHLILASCHGKEKRTHATVFRQVSGVIRTSFGSPILSLSFLSLSNPSLSSCLCLFLTFASFMLTLVSTRHCRSILNMHHTEQVVGAGQIAGCFSIQHCDASHTPFLHTTDAGFGTGS